MMQTLHSDWIHRWFLLSLAFVLASGCGRRADDVSADADGRTIITVWAHHGKPEEWRTIQEQVQRFNDSQAEVRVKLVEVAEANYDTQVQSAAASRKLPDVLEFDGPMLANYVWKGILAPLGDTLDAQVLADLLPSIRAQGSFAGGFYAVGTFDSGLGLYANRSMLEAIGARIPTGPQEAWTISEFNEILRRLSKLREQAGPSGQVLDLKRDYRGEWWTYGFYPILVSAGADLIDRKKYQSAAGLLNSPAAIQALQHVQHWFQSGYVDPNTDSRAFVDKRAALSWTGHWDYPGYAEALGEDLLLLPLPNFGEGTRTGMGSWAWGITRQCQHPQAAARFIEFLLQPDEILALVQANGAVPATQTAIGRSELYAEQGALHLFAEQLQEQVAVPRPVTPAYPVITSVFQQALLNIIQGADVKTELDKAVQAIDQDIRDNQGYPLPETGN